MTLPLFDLLDRLQQDAHGPCYMGPSRPVAFGSQPETGADLKAEGMDSAMKPKPSKVYQGRLEDALLHFKVRDTFTVEQLTGIAGRPEIWGAHFNSVGAIVNGMAKRGLIEKTGRMVQAQRPNMHATELAQWRLVKYANDAISNSRVGK